VENWLDFPTGSGGEQCKVHLAAGCPSEVSTGSILFDGFDNNLDDGMERALSGLMKGFKRGDTGC